MPLKDGNGPTGKGPMTGRGSGQCILPINTAQEEMNFLKNRASGLREQLQQIETRVKDIKVTVWGSEK
jgi:hypothetical protein